MSPGRRWPSLLSRMFVSSARGATARSPGTRGPGGPGGPGGPAGRTGTVLPSTTGGLMGTSSSRFFSAPLVLPDQDQDPVLPDQDQDQDQADPDQLLRECEEALLRRPARPHRVLVQTQTTTDHNPTIRIMQWNILAQALGEGTDGFVRCPLDALKWTDRKFLILEEILRRRPDILCLQEVDHYHDTFQPILARLGYHGDFLAKPWSPCLDVDQNNGPDGCALFYRRSRFSPLATARLRLSAAFLPTNQVAIVQTLRCHVTGRRLCVAVTHLKARSGWERLRSAQGADLLQRLSSITAEGVGPEGAEPEGAGPGGVPLVVCGDFNAEPSEDVYRRFSSSPLGLDSAYRLLSPEGAEPDYTTWKIRPSGESRATLDYIWYSHDALRVQRLLDIPSEDQIGPDRLPSYHYPSDHLSLLCDLSFKEPITAQL